MTHYVYQSRTSPDSDRWVTIPETVDAADPVRVQSVLDNIAQVNRDMGWERLRLMRTRQITRWELYGDPVTTVGEGDA